MRVLSVLADVARVDDASVTAECVRWGWL